MQLLTQCNRRTKSNIQTRISYSSVKLKVDECEARRSEPKWLTYPDGGGGGSGNASSSLTPDSREMEVRSLSGRSCNLKKETINSGDLKMHIMVVVHRSKRALEKHTIYRSLQLISCAFNVFISSQLNTAFSNC